MLQAQQAPQRDPCQSDAGPYREHKKKQQLDTERREHYVHRLTARVQLSLADSLNPIRQTEGAHPAWQ